jgi:hypothetical protein
VPDLDHLVGGDTGELVGRHIADAVAGSLDGVHLDLGEVRRESQIGSVDLRCAWTVRVWCRGDALKTGEAAALGVLGQVVAAVDADEQLGGVVESATVESVSRERVEAPPESGREFVTFVLTVVTSSLH